MTRRILLILALVAASLCAAAQQPDILDQLRQHPEYLAGTDPTDADSVLLTGIRFPDGTPEVTWTPDLESERDYRVLAKKALTDTDWTDVTDLDDRSAYHFFTVEVRPVE